MIRSDVQVWLATAPVDMRKRCAFRQPHLQSAAGTGQYPAISNKEMIDGPRKAAGLTA